MDSFCARYTLVVMLRIWLSNFVGSVGCHAGLRVFHFEFLKPWSCADFDLDSRI